MNNLHHADMFDIMPDIEPGSIDFVFLDLPFGVTALDWDIKIDLEKLWTELKRIVKKNAAIVMKGTDKFANELINSNRKQYRYKWYWNKSLSANFMLANIQPLPVIEEILVFSEIKAKYTPEMLKGKYRMKGGEKTSEVFTVERIKTFSGKYYPTNYLSIPNANQAAKIHPTQTPVRLLEYLIRTYTDSNDLVFDGCCGSGTTAIACLNLDRNYICVEKDKDYYLAAKKRIENHQVQTSLI